MNYQNHFSKIKQKLIKLISDLIAINEKQYFSKIDYDNFLVLENEKISIAEEILKIKDDINEIERQELFSLLQKVIELINSIKQKTIKAEKNDDIETINSKDAKSSWGWVKLFLVGLPILLIIFIGIKLYQARNYKAVYNVDLDETKFKDKNLSLYINEDSKDIKFGKIVAENNLKYHDILGSPINFVFNPEEYLYGKELKVSTLFRDSGDWQIRMICDKCDNSSDAMYSWQPYYYGNLRDYKIIRNYEELNIYSKEISESQLADNTENWLKNNLPPGSSLDIKNNIYPLSKLGLEISDFSPGSTTEINTPMRGAHDFYVYLDNKLEMDIIKKDINSSEGSDVVKVNLSDVDGNIVMENIIEDDGIDTIDAENFGAPVAKKFDYIIPKKGTYKLSFFDAEINKSDWTIKYLKINTNKIVFTGTVYLLDQSNLYTEIKENKKISIYGWTTNAKQDINISSAIENKIIPITIKEIGTEQLIDLNPEKYTISTKGNLRIKGANFSVSPDRYFEPFLYDLTKLSDQKVVITDYVFENSEFDQNTVKVIVNYDNPPLGKKIEYQLRNRKLENVYKQKQNLYNNGLYYLSTYGDYELWGKRDLKSYNYTATNLYEWLNGVLPSRSSILNNEKIALDQASLISDTEPNAFVMTENPENETSLSLRGNHAFYLYVNGNLRANIDLGNLNWSEGKDDVKFSLMDSKGVVKCENLYEDDGNKSADQNSTSKTINYACDNLAKGTYILEINGIPDNITNVNNDFSITKIAFNTNKIVLKNKIFNLDQLEVYTNNATEREIDAYYFHKGSNQDITITGTKNNKYTLSTKDINKHKKIILPSGQSNINIAKGDIVLTNSNFAFQKNQWFEPTNVYVTEGNFADFALVNNVNNTEPSYIKQISVEVDNK